MNTNTPITVKRNPFRVALYRKAFDNLVSAYNQRLPELIGVPGARPGNSVATEFWRGFDSVDRERTWKNRNLVFPYRTRTDKDSLGYAYWLAGRSVAQAIEATEAQRAAKVFDAYYSTGQTG